jgi:aspartate kinase
MARRLVVMKFGGTSVADAEGRAALRARVEQARASGLDVVVVVSAMGRAGKPYATDTLLALIGGGTDSRERDMLAACGEIVSAVVVAHELRSSGTPAEAFTGADAGIVTDAGFGAARIVSLHPARLNEAIGRGVVPVVAGFQGVSADGDTTTLGRGGSDTSACALGVALAAEAVEIYTDVDGVMSADPRECADAAVLDGMRFEELFEMANAGAKVMHAPAAELAMDAGVPVRVRSTFSGEPGTLIADVAPAKGVATAVTHVDGVAQLRVSLPSAAGDIAHMHAQTGVYRAMADAGVSLDMFTPCCDMLVFTVSEAALADAQDALRRLGLAHEVSTGLAKVTLVGAGMRGVPGVMARVAESLCAAGVPILQTADSHTTISVLVTGEDRHAAVRTLHEAFALGEES